ncbi:MAG: HEAT repeat domain-containing protein [Myxococcota bacterium]
MLPLDRIVAWRSEDLPSGYAGALRALLGLDVRTERDLLRALAAPWGEHSPAACLIAGRTGNPTFARPLLRLLVQEEASERLVEVAKALSRTAHTGLISSISVVLSSNPREERRWAAAIVLSYMSDDTCIKPLARRLDDSHESAGVRGQAAEGLGSTYMCGPDRRNRRMRLAESSLLRNLRDPSAEVRFWCCYGLGALRSRKARGVLAHLARTDTGVVPGWWSVAEEATDAVTKIDGGEPEGRATRP